MSNGVLILLGGLLGEVVLLTLVLLSIAYLRNRAQRKRDLKAAQTLIARIKNGKAEREKTIVQFLAQGMGLSGEALQQAKVAILRGELGLLQRMAGIYRQRDAAGLARIDDELFAAIGPYHALTGEAMETAGRETATLDNDEFERLRKENQRLSEELTITMETMSRMLSEYSSVFAGGSPNGEPAVGSTVDAAVEAVAEDEDVMTASSEDVAESAAAPDHVQAAAAEAVEIAATAAGEAWDSADVHVVSEDIETPSVSSDAQTTDDVIVAAAAAPADPDATSPSEKAAHAQALETPVEVDAAGPPASDEDDEIEAIIREAQSQEMSTRDSADRSDEVVDGGESTAAGGVKGGKTSPPPGLDSLAGASLDVIQDLDDLFDAAGDDIDAAVDAAAAADAPLTSRGNS